MPYTIEQLASHIAADSAKYICEKGIHLASHAALAYGAHKAVNAAKTEATTLSKTQQLLAWVNPSNTLKKLLAFGVAEATLSKTLHSVATNFSTMGTKFLTPILERGLQPVLQHCFDQGYFALPQAPVEAWYDKWVMPKVAPLIAEVPMRALIAPHPLFQWAVDAYQYADQYAPQAGKLVADFIESGCQTGQQWINSPPEIIKTISDVTGVSYPVALASTMSLTAFGGYLGKMGINMMYQAVTQSQKTTVTTTAASAAQGGNVNFIQNLDARAFAKEFFLLFAQQRGAGGQAAVATVEEIKQLAGPAPKTL